MVGDVPHLCRSGGQEGFPAIAETFRKIATVEQHHEARYRKLAENVREGTVFAKKQETQWKCRNCGYIHTRRHGSQGVPRLRASPGIL